MPNLAEKEMRVSLGTELSIERLNCSLSKYKRDVHQLHSMLHDDEDAVVALIQGLVSIPIQPAMSGAR